MHNDDPKMAETSLGSRLEEPAVQTIKCMVVGDTGTGKTQLFKKMTDQELPLEYTPTVFDVINQEVELNGESVNLTIWDSAGSHVYDSIRPISYAHTDCFIVCFASGDKESLRNVEDRWLPEIVRHGDGPSVPIILVETSTEGPENHCEGMKTDVISPAEVDDVKEKIKAKAVFHFSPKADPNAVKTILRKAMELAYIKKVEEEKPPNPIWKFHSLAFLVVGDPGVGKTSFIESIITDKHENLKYGTDKSKQEYYHDLVTDGCEYFVRLMELQLSRRTEIINLSKEADALVLCYAIDDPFSFQSVDLFCRNDLGKLRKNLPIILTGTKCDLKEVSSIIIPTQDGEALVSEMKFNLFFECSAVKPVENNVIKKIIDICKHQDG